ncbi:Ppx/GppA phosphatase family protein [Brevundimonas aveniformis]|uniref:Ppx/GppA phosphatase family protein n=1 Tax=Brevundimonas aveniformis TaxID=370977 RepID=UPI0003FF8A5E|nr:Ppx/GppA phosphatase family protein [Brevundimonas aveniformis]
MTASADFRTREAAVLDVGSNSVRLVVYGLQGRAIWTGYNEKVLAGLGREVAATGKLSGEGVAEAVDTIRRFAVLMETLPLAERHIVATAAVREAIDGPGFCDRVVAETGLKIRVLSGEEEARYAALGVIAGNPAAEGVVADLGGSSLELVPVTGGEAGQGVTLPLGPFAMEADDDDPIAEIDTRLRPAKGFEAKTLHAVGGAWRSLALLHMRQERHALEIVHQYEMSAAQVDEMAALLGRLSRPTLEKLARTNRARALTLPHAARVLSRLCRKLGVRTVSFSAYGLREGLLLEAMTPAVRARDPLLEGCRALGDRESLEHGLDRVIVAWLKPVLSPLKPQFSAERDAVMLSAGAALADVGSRLHPDHRADVAFEQVLRAPVAGLVHAERAFLASAIHARYGGQGAPEAQLVARLLGTGGLERARLHGLALRLASDLSARSAELLSTTRLVVDGPDLVLRVGRAHADLLRGDKVRKRLGTLAQALDLSARLEVETT